MRKGKTQRSEFAPLVTEEHADRTLDEPSHSLAREDSADLLGMEEETQSNLGSEAVTQDERSQGQRRSQAGKKNKNRGKVPTKSDGAGIDADGKPEKAWRRPQAASYNEDDEAPATAAPESIPGGQSEVEHEDDAEASEEMDE